MKYDLTNESYLSENLSNFPEAHDINFLDMLLAAIFYNLLPMIISFISYFPIVWLIRKLLKNSTKLRLIITGVVLTGTTPLIYWWASDWKHNSYYQVNAETISWTLTFLLSTLTYYLLNRKEKLN